jgi:hypothetical protein
MRRSRAQLDAGSVSLFPFLAVLLCTMGALIVILVVVASQARASAAARAAEQAAEQLPADPPVDPIELEMAQWRVEQLAAARDQTSADLERARLELSGIEDHLRRLQQERDELARAAGALAAAGQQNETQRAALAADVDRANQQVARLELEVAAARKKSAGNRPSYSIVPYEGPNRTRRRPLFIECTADRVILQPERIVLTEQDFLPPLGPGNPLAAALRASSEYLDRNDPSGGAEKPYPLIVVRPAGINAYYAVRRALSSWGSDFGYEMIDEDWKLEFPPVEPGLAETQRRAVESGRRYQQQLAAAAPSQYGRRKPRYRASPTRGGFVMEGGEAGGSGRRGGGGFGSGQDGFGRESGDDRFAGQNGGGADGQSAGDATSGGAGGNPYEGIAGSAGEPGSDRRAGPPGEGAGGRGATAGSATQGSADRYASQGSPNRKGGTSGGSQTGSGEQSSGGSPGAGSSGQGTMGQGSSQSTTQNRQPHPAELRGEDWALRNAARGATPVTRPVRVMCLSDRVVILPEDGRGAGQTVMMPGATRDALDDFTSAMWAHMEGWGIAGNRLYWRPVLSLQSDAQGARRASELSYLLDGSGFDIRRK